MQTWQDKDKANSPDADSGVVEPAQKAAIKRAVSASVPAWANASAEALPAGLQAKLTVNRPGDVYEREADRVAEQVMRMSGGKSPATRKDISLMLKANSGEQVTHEAPPIVNQALSGNGQPLDADTQEVMGARFGTDFNHVRVHADEQAKDSAQAIHARAYTVGSDVVFGEGQYQPGTQDGQRLIAHELTHVVQQGGGVTGANIFTSPGVKSVQRFSPPGHLESTLVGLKDSYSAEDIGQIEAANWERDFSQGPPRITNVVIAWTDVKLSAMQNNGVPSPKLVAIFRERVETALGVGLMDLKNEQGLGGYRSWEHMDNPDAKAETDANQRWYGKIGKMRLEEGALPGYILDSRAYIKDNIIAAVDTYRKEKHIGGGLGASFDPWEGVKRPEGYRDPQHMTEADLNDPQVLPRTPIASEAAEMAKAVGAKSSGATLSHLTADHLGRAMHAMQDFFAHSTWLARAMALKAGREPDQPLITGTFNMEDKVQSFGYKLLAVAELLQRDYDFLLKIYSLQSEKDIRPQKNPLTAQSTTLVGEIYDVTSAAHTVRDQQAAGRARIEDYALSKTLIEQLAVKGRHMVERGTREAPRTAHARIAKDEPEESGYRDALVLAAEADKMVIAPLRAIMDNPDDEAAKKQLADILLLVDVIIEQPGTEHPLYKKVIAQEFQKTYDKPEIMSLKRVRYERGEQKASGSSPGQIDSQGDKRFILYDLAVNQAQLKPMYEQFLRELVDRFQLDQEYPRAFIRLVEGYSDLVDVEKVNASLRRMRADAVAQFLMIKLRVPASNVDVVRGASVGGLITSNTTPAGRALNRGVVVELEKVTTPRTRRKSP